MEKLNYDERLKKLGLMRLDGRRVRSDLIEVFKMINVYYVGLLTINLNLIVNFWKIND